MPRTKPEPLTKFYNQDWNKLEVGIDEAGRGPLFGRVYTAAVILPKDCLLYTSPSPRDRG